MTEEKIFYKEKKMSRIEYLTEKLNENKLNYDGMVHSSDFGVWTHEDEDVQGYIDRFTQEFENQLTVDRYF